jgi:hypothetical protein
VIGVKGIVRFGLEAGKMAFPPWRKHGHEGFIFRESGKKGMIASA